MPNVFQEFLSAAKEKSDFRSAKRELTDRNPALGYVFSRLSLKRLEDGSVNLELPEDMRIVLVNIERDGELGEPLECVRSHEGRTLQEAIKNVENYFSDFLEDVSNEKLPAIRVFEERLARDDYMYIYINAKGDKVRTNKETALQNAAALPTADRGQTLVAEPST